MIYYDVENDILLSEAEIKANFDKYHDEYLPEYDSYIDFIDYMVLTGALEMH